MTEWRCCCCCGSRTCAMIVGWFHLILGIIAIIVSAAVMVRAGEGSMQGVHLASIITILVFQLFPIALLIGVQKERPAIIMLWIVGMYLQMIFIVVRDIVVLCNTDFSNTSRGEMVGTRLLHLSALVLGFWFLNIVSAHRRELLQGRERAARGEVLVPETSASAPPAPPEYAEQDPAMKRFESFN